LYYSLILNDSENILDYESILIIELKNRQLSE